MDDLEQFEPAFQRILVQLRPYLDDVVLIGGWVPFLYRRYGGFKEWRSRTSRTAELDVLLIPPLPAGDRPPLAKVLTDARLHPADQSAAAAVWEGDPHLGEVIEFLVPHEGTARQVGRVRSVDGQAGIGGISLPDVDLLHQHSVTLNVPVIGVDEAITTLRVRVPRLGAYLTGKAATFFKRQQMPTATGAARAEQKRAKDLLYIRDLMAAGPEVESRIRSDLAELRKTTRGRNWVSYGATQLGLLLGGSNDILLEEAAAMLAERDGLSPERAKADLRGHLTDARETLRPPKQRRR